MAKNNRNIFQSINKDILKGFKRIYLYNYLRLKKVLLSLNSKDLKRYNISILYPTRERSAKFNRMLNSLIVNCNDPSRINLMLLFDTDEPELNKYKQIMETLDIIGWIATALVIFSFMINDMLRLRFVNLIGAAFWLAYGIVDLSSSIIFLNVVIVSIQAFKISRLIKKEKN